MANSRFYQKFNIPPTSSTSSLLLETWSGDMDEYVKNILTEQRIASAEKIIQALDEKIAIDKNLVQKKGISVFANGDRLKRINSIITTIQNILRKILFTSPPEPLNAQETYLQDFILRRLGTKPTNDPKAKAKALLAFWRYYPDDKKLNYSVLTQENIGICELTGKRKTQEDRVPAGTLNVAPENLSVLSHQDWQSIFQETITSLHDKTQKLKSSGSTFCATTVIGNKIINANLGDSEAFLVKIDANGVPSISPLYRALHTPSDPAEKKRIGEAGGVIRTIEGIERIIGANQKSGISVSGGIGDRDFANLITQTPDVNTHLVDLQPGERAFVVAACDGLREGFEGLTEEKISDWVNKLKDQTTDEMARTIALEAFYAGSHDNISVAVVEIKPDDLTPRVFAICDGHGGDQVSKILNNELLPTLQDKTDEKLKSKPSLNPTQGSNIIIKMDDEESSEEEMTNRHDSQVVQLPQLPPQVNPAHIEFFDEKTNIAFILTEEQREQVLSNSAIVKDRRYKKNQLKIPYDIYKNGKNFYAIYKGIKQGAHLGSGVYGAVKLAQNIQTGDWVALKMQTGSLTHKPGELLETQVLDKLERLKGEFTNESQNEKAMRHGILMAHAPGVELENLLHTLSLPEAELWGIAAQISTQLTELKNLKFLHRDIKLSNIIYDRETRTATLIDFGTAIGLKGDQTEILNEPYMGTIEMMPPELEKGKRNRYSVDTEMYSFGMTLAHLFGFLDEDYKLVDRNHSQFKHNRYVVNKKRREDLHTLIRGLTHKDPDKRTDIQTTSDFIHAQSKKFYHHKKMEKILILDLSDKYLLEELRRYDQIILVDSSKLIESNPNTYLSVKAALELKKIVVSDRVWVNSDFNAAVKDIRREYFHAQVNVNSYRYMRNNLLNLADIIVNNTWRVRGGLFAGHGIKRKDSAGNLQKNKIPAHVKQILDCIDKAEKSKITYHSAFEKVLKIAVQEMNAKTFLTLRDPSTQKFYNNIFATLNIDVLKSLGNIEAFIRSSTSSNEWGKGRWLQFHKRPTTVDKMLKILTEHGNAEVKLQRVLLLAIEAARENDQLLNLRSKTTENFYANIMRFVEIIPLDVSPNASPPASLSHLNRWLTAFSINR